MTVTNRDQCRAVGLDSVLEDSAVSGSGGDGGDDSSLGRGGSRGSKASKKKSSKKTAGGGAAGQDEGGAEESIETIAEEYTFSSAADAADFQSAVLALRVAGKEIRNMYCALELLHMSSEAYCKSDDACWLRGPESVGASADAEGKKEEKKAEGYDGDDAKKKEEEDPLAHRGRPPAGVALDDVVRCLGEVPSVRRMLDRYFSYHYPHLGKKGMVVANRRRRGARRRRRRH
uniref:Uncharacterized protein n=1 Tax=Odontella aurita TaxID=265563 RepID=A0A7S4J8Q8_9STRA